MEQLEKLASGEFGGMQHKQRYINILNNQIEQKRKEIEEKKNQKEKIKETAQGINSKYEKVSIF